MSLFSDPYPQKQERDQKCLSIILSVSIQSLTHYLKQRNLPINKTKWNWLENGVELKLKLRKHKNPKSSISVLLYVLRNHRIERSTECTPDSLPPVMVSVANSYSATVNPALLWAVILRLYQVAGSRSNTTKLPPGLTLFEIWFHSGWSLWKMETL